MDERPKPTDSPVDEHIAEQLAALRHTGDPCGMAELRQRVQARMRAEDRTLAGWLWSLPTPMRMLIAVLSSGVVVALVALLGLRADFAEYPTFRMGLVLGSLGALLTACLLLSLRPLYRPALPDWASWSLAATALVTAFVMCALPAARPEAHALARGELLSGAGACAGLGFVMALPVYVVARLLSRGIGAVLLAALAAGLTGVLALQLRCPYTAPEHLVAGHFAVALAFVAVHKLLERAERRVLRGH